MNGLISIELVGYLIARGRQKPLRKVLRGSLIFYGVVTIAASFAPLAAGAMLLGRVIGLALSATSFYREHGMVDINEPENVWRNSLTFLDPECDHGALGDDLHVEHHLRPGVHWSSYSASLQQNRSRYEKEQALGFVGSQGGIREYYAALWSADFVRLSQLFVLVASPRPKTQDIADLLRERSRPLVARPDWQWTDSWDRWAGSSLARLIPRFVD